MEQQLSQCVEYFTKGSWAEWIVGGIIVAVTLVSSLTKWNIPTTLKSILNSITKQK